MAVTASGVGVPAGVSAAPTPDPPTTPWSPPGSWLTVFEDEFDGNFNGELIDDEDLADGSVGTPDGLDDRIWMAPGDSPDALTYQVTDDAGAEDPGQPSDGYLRLRAFTSGGVNFLPQALATGGHSGESLFETTYGYAEVRAKVVPKASPGWSFFLMPQDVRARYRDQAYSGTEIDVFEQTGSEIFHSLHWDGDFATPDHQSDGSNNVNHLCGPDNDVPCDEDFHTFGVLWEPAGYVWYVDGVAVNFAQYPDERVTRGVSHAMEFLYLWGASISPTDDFGPFGDPDNPYALIDYVKVWQPAISEIPDTTTQRFVPLAVPFTVSSIHTDDLSVPAPRVATVDTQLAGNCTNVIRAQDVAITGTGADRALGVMTRAVSGVTGTCTVTVRGKDAGGAVLGSESFNVTVTNPAATVPAFGDLIMTSAAPRAVELREPVGTTAVSVTSSNDYLLPEANVAIVRGENRYSTLLLSPRPDRTGTAEVTLNFAGPSPTSTAIDVTVTLPTVDNAGFEATTLEPWDQVPVTGGAVASGAHSGAKGFRTDGVALLTQGPLAVEPNHSYTLSAWGRTRAAGGSFVLGVDLDLDPQDQSLAELQTTYTSTGWERRSITFTTGPTTTEVGILANNVFVSNIGYDLDDVDLSWAPSLTHVADQSIGHATCVAPTFRVGRVGDPADAWTATASVVAGDPTLLSGLTVVDAPAGQTQPPDDAYHQAVRITPTGDTTKSGPVTVRLTATGPDGVSNSDDFTVWVNAGSFWDGSFEEDPFTTFVPSGGTAWPYPGCTLGASLGPAWSPGGGGASGGRTDMDTYDSQVAYINRTLKFDSGALQQAVTGLQANTNYTLSGWYALAHWPNAPGDARLGVTGDVSAVGGQPLEVTRTTPDWVPVSITFRTGSTGTATVRLTADDTDGANSGAQYQDLRLIKVP